MSIPARFERLLPERTRTGEITPKAAEEQNSMTHDKRIIPIAAKCLGAVLLAMLVSTSAVLAQSTDGPENKGSLQIIPSLGISKSTDTGAKDAQAFGGLAVRVPVGSVIKLEGSIAYRQDTYGGGALRVRQWPTTASVWLSPVRSVYLGGGVGWYHTTLLLPDELHIANTTTDKAGVHIGGGIDVPVAPRLSLDLNGRYVFMTKDKASFDVPTTFNPDYWNMSLGMAISF
jgi:hypothetical protein